MTDTRACHCAQGAREPSDFEDVREVAAAFWEEEDQTEQRAREEQRAYLRAAKKRRADQDTRQEERRAEEEQEQEEQEEEQEQGGGGGRSSGRPRQRPCHQRFATACNCATADSTAPVAAHRGARQSQGAGIHAGGGQKGRQVRAQVTG